MLGNKSIKAALLVTMLGLVGMTLSTQASAACNLVKTTDGLDALIIEVTNLQRLVLDAQDIAHAVVVVEQMLQ